MPKSHYDPKKPTSYIYLLDFNLLYHSIIADFRLPTHGFKWLTWIEKDSLDVMNIADDSDTGYILVVGLEIPVEHHKLYDQFPLCPENVVIGEEHVSPYTREMSATCGIQLRRTKKLCLSLTDKTHYLVHYMTLQAT